MTRSRNYYKVRTIVRISFWSSVALGGFLAVGKVTAHHDETDKPPCDISLHIDFSWSWNGWAVPLDECSTPKDVVVKNDGTWDWYLPPVLGGK